MKGDSLSAATVLRRTQQEEFCQNMLKGVNKTLTVFPCSVTCAKEDHQLSTSKRESWNIKGTFMGGNNLLICYFR